MFIVFESYKHYRNCGKIVEGKVVSYLRPIPRRRIAKVEVILRVSEPQQKICMSYQLHAPLALSAVLFRYVQKGRNIVDLHVNVCI
jgi:hypothetical protein